MKVTVTETEKEKDIEFPCLMIHEDIIILARSINGDKMTGTRIIDGYYYQTWNADVFKPFKGTVTLQND